MIKEEKLIENERIKNDWLGKLDQDCRNISETVKHCLDIQVKLLNLFDVVRKQDNFQPMN